jgi:uncharacterized protein YceH (UPF0502 family)
MRYLQRDQAGKVVGHFACEQTYATELVPDDHPDLVAWEAAREEARRQAREQSPSKTIPRLEQRVAQLEQRVADLEELVKARG